MTIAFSIAYRGDNPGMVQKVAGTLASLYLEQNLKTREAQAQSTTKFLEAELKELQERIKFWAIKSPRSKKHMRVCCRSSNSLTGIKRLTWI